MNDTGQTRPKLRSDQQLPQISSEPDRTKPSSSEKRKRWVQARHPSPEACTGITYHHRSGRRRSYSCSVDGTMPCPPDSLTLDQREKVSVRLVKDQGLVVAPDDEEDEPVAPLKCADLIADDKRRPCQDCEKSRRNTVSSDLRALSPTSTAKKSFPDKSRESGPIPSSSKQSTISENFKIGQKLKRNDLLSISNESEAKPENVRPFGGTRQGSSNGIGPVGVSSMTPLMGGIKESHKIQVVIKPSSSSMMKSYNGSSIHLCCALVFVFSASIFSSLTLLLAKVLKNRGHHPISIAFWRYLGIFIPAIPLLIFHTVRGKREKIIGSIWPIIDTDKAANLLLLLMRGILGATAIIIRYCSLKYMTIANTSVISYSAPVFAAIFAPLCFRKSKSGFIPLAFGVTAGFGIFLLSRPPLITGLEWEEKILKGVLLSSLSTCCSTAVIISLQHLLERVHFSLMLLVLGAWGTFEAGVFAVSLEVLKVPELISDIVMIFGVALLSFFSQLFLLLAMRMGHIGSVSVMKSCDILLSFLWQYLFLKTKVESFEIFSTFLIVSSVWLVCLRKWLGNQRSNNVIKKKLSFLLH